MQSDQTAPVTPVSHQQTRTSETEGSYETRFTELANRYRQERGIEPNAAIDIIDFARWLTGRQATLAYNTWRQYRAAVAYHCRTDHPAGWKEALAILQAKHTGPKKTSTQSNWRRRGFPPEDRAKILTHIYGEEQRRRAAAEERGGTPDRIYFPLGLHLAAFLEAGVLTGLRPSEWRRAILKRTNHWQSFWPTPDSGPFLIVNNAKTTNQRSIGPTRTLSLSPLTAVEIQKVSDLIRLVADLPSEKKFHDLLRNLRRLLLEVNREIWPKRKEAYALYHTRHQFTANAKARRSTVEVAALLGQAHETTSKRHYAYARCNEFTEPRHRAAVSGVPLPHPHNVLAVRLEAHPNPHRRPESPAPTQSISPSTDATRVETDRHKTDADEVS